MSGTGISSSSLTIPECSVGYGGRTELTGVFGRVLRPYRTLSKNLVGYLPSKYPRSTLVRTLLERILGSGVSNHHCRYLITLKSFGIRSPYRVSLVSVTPSDSLVKQLSTAFALSKRALTFLVSERTSCRLIVDS